jgi:undecaprenyl diphosphate synthase
MNSASELSQKTPTCVGIIMDGNRRWARARNLPTFEGHQKGYAKLKEVAEWCKEAGVAHLALYAFSTENWNRSKEEVSYLMDLFGIMLRTELPKLRKENTAVYVAGKIELFPESLQKAILDMHATNPKDATQHIWVCASYGGRAEILAGVNALLASGVKEVDEQAFADSLWTAGMPEPDIIVRTSGEHRLSGFLTWASVYSELFFIDSYWPDFSKREFMDVLEEYYARERMRGV